MVKCSICNERQAEYDGLCEQCYSKRSGKIKGMGARGLTFDEFEARFLKEDGVTGLFYADDALLEYEYYKEYINYNPYSAGRISKITFFIRRPQQTEYFP